MAATTSSTGQVSRLQQTTERLRHETSQLRERLRGERDAVRALRAQHAAELRAERTAARRKRVELQAQLQEVNKTKHKLPSTSYTCEQCSKNRALHEAEIRKLNADFKKKEQQLKGQLNEKSTSLVVASSCDQCVTTKALHEAEIRKLNADFKKKEQQLKGQLNEKSTSLVVASSCDQCATTKALHEADVRKLTSDFKKKEQQLKGQLNDKVAPNVISASAYIASCEQCAKFKAMHDAEFRKINVEFKKKEHQLKCQLNELRKNASVDCTDGGIQSCQQRLTADLTKQKEVIKDLEERLQKAVDADRLKAADLRAQHEKHVTELSRITRANRHDAHKLLEELKTKDRIIAQLRRSAGKVRTKGEDAGNEHSQMRKLREEVRKNEQPALLPLACDPKPETVTHHDKFRQNEVELNVSIKQRDQMVCGAANEELIEHPETDTDSAVSSAPSSLSPQPCSPAAAVLRDHATPPPTSLSPQPSEGYTTPPPGLWPGLESYDDDEGVNSELAMAKRQVRELERALLVTRATKSSSRHVTALSERVRQLEDREAELLRELGDLREQNELLEFRVLELAECPDKSFISTTNWGVSEHSDVATATDDIPELLNDEPVRTRIADICSKTDNIEDKKCLLQVLMLLHGLDELSKRKEIYDSDAAIQIYNEREVTPPVSLMSVRGARDRTGPDRDRLIAKVPPFTGRTAESDDDRESPLRSHESSIPPTLVNSRGTQTDVTEGTTVEDSTKSLNLTTEVRKLDKLRETIDRTGRLVVSGSGCAGGCEQKHLRQLEFYRERVDVLERKLCVYESSGELQARQLAERLSREVRLEAQVKQLTSALNTLQSENSRLEEERCELEEAENDTRLRCQRLETDILQLERSRMAAKRRSRENRQQATYWETMVSKYEESNYELEERECELRHRLEVMEKTAPAILLFNMWKMLQDDPKLDVASATSNKLKNAGSTGRSSSIPRAKSRSPQRKATDIVCSCTRDDIGENVEEKIRDLEDQRNKLVQAKQDMERKVHVLESQLNDLKHSATNTSPSSSSAPNSGPSLTSLMSGDYELISVVHELKERENDMRKRIEELEKREAAYMETLQQADEIWAEMECGYKKRISEAEQSEANTRDRLRRLEKRVPVNYDELDNAERELAAQTQRLSRDNIRLQTEKKRLENELQCLCRMRDEKSRELETRTDKFRGELECERRRSQELEQRLLDDEAALSEVSRTYSAEIESLRERLARTSNELVHLEVTNGELREEVETLEGKIAEVERGACKRAATDEQVIRGLSQELNDRDRELADMKQQDLASRAGERLGTALQGVKTCDVCSHTVSPNLVQAMEGVRTLCSLISHPSSRPPDDTQVRNKSSNRNVVVADKCKDKCLTGCKHLILEQKSASKKATHRNKEVNTPNISELDKKSTSIKMPSESSSKASSVSKLSSVDLESSEPESRKSSKTVSSATSDDEVSNRDTIRAEAGDTPKVKGRNSPKSLSQKSSLKSAKACHNNKISLTCEKKSCTSTCSMKSINIPAKVAISSDGSAKFVSATNPSNTVKLCQMEAKLPSTKESTCTKISYKPTCENSSKAIILADVQSVDQYDLQTEVMVAGQPKYSSIQARVDMDTDHEIDEVTVMASVTESGNLELTTESPPGLIEHTMMYTPSGNMEITTGFIPGAAEELDKIPSYFHPEKESLPPDIKISQEALSVDETLATLPDAGNTDALKKIYEKIFTTDKMTYIEEKVSTHPDTISAEPGILSEKSKNKVHSALSDKVQADAFGVTSATEPKILSEIIAEEAKDDEGSELYSTLLFTEELDSPKMIESEQMSYTESIIEKPFMADHMSISMEPGTAGDEIISNVISDQSFKRKDSTSNEKIKKSSAGSGDSLVGLLQQVAHSTDKITEIISHLSKSASKKTPEKLLNESEVIIESLEQVSKSSIEKINEITGNEKIHDITGKEKISEIIGEGKIISEITGEIKITKIEKVRKEPSEKVTEPEKETKPEQEIGSKESSDLSGVKIKESSEKSSKELTVIDNTETTEKDKDLADNISTEVETIASAKELEDSIASVYSEGESLKESDENILTEDTKSGNIKTVAFESQVETQSADVESAYDAEEIESNESDESLPKKKKRNEPIVMSLIIEPFPKKKMWACSTASQTYQRKSDLYSLKSNSPESKSKGTQLRPKSSQRSQGSGYEPRSQGSQCQPKSQGSQSQPRSQGFQSQPRSQESQSQPRSQGSQSQPKSQGFQSPPRSQGSQSQPRSQGSGFEPRSQCSQCQPRSQGSQSQSRSQGFQSQLRSQESQSQPKSQGSQSQPKSQGFQSPPRSQGSQSKSQTKLEEIIRCCVCPGGILPVRPPFDAPQTKSEGAITCNPCPVGILPVDLYSQPQVSQQIFCVCPMYQNIPQQQPQQCVPPNQLPGGPGPSQMMQHQMMPVPPPPPMTCLCQPYMPCPAYPCGPSSFGFGYGTPALYGAQQYPPMSQQMPYQHVQQQCQQCQAQNQVPYQTAQNQIPYETVQNQVPYEIVQNQVPYQNAQQPGLNQYHQNQDSINKCSSTCTVPPPPPPPRNLCEMYSCEAYAKEGGDISVAVTARSYTSGEKAAGEDTSEYISAREATEEDTSEVEAVEEDTSGVEAAEGDTSGEEAAEEDTSGVEAAEEDTSGIEAAEGDTSGVEAEEEDTSVVEAASEDTSVVEAASEDTSVVEAASEDTSVVEAASEDTSVAESVVEAASKDTSVVESASQDTSVVDAASKDTSVAAASKDTSVVEAASKDTSVVAAASQDTSVAGKTDGVSKAGDAFESTTETISVSLEISVDESKSVTSKSKYPPEILEKSFEAEHISEYDASVAESTEKSLASAGDAVQYTATEEYKSPMSSIKTSGSPYSRIPVAISPTRLSISKRDEANISGSGKISPKSEKAVSGKSSPKKGSTGKLSPKVSPGVIPQGSRGSRGAKISFHVKDCSCKECKCNPCKDPKIPPYKRRDYNAISDEEGCPVCRCEVCRCKNCIDPRKKDGDALHGTGLPCDCEEECECAPCKDPKILDTKGEICSKSKENSIVPATTLDTNNEATAVTPGEVLTSTPINTTVIMEPRDTGESSSFFSATTDSAGSSVPTDLSPTPMTDTAGQPAETPMTITDNPPDLGSSTEYDTTDTSGQPAETPMTITDNPPDLGSSTEYDTTDTSGQPAETPMTITDNPPDLVSSTEYDTTDTSGQPAETPMTITDNPPDLGSSTEYDITDTSAATPIDEECPYGADVQIPASIPDSFMPNMPSTEISVLATIRDIPDITSTPVSPPTAISTPAGTCPYTLSIQVGGRKVDIYYPRSATSSRTVNVCPSAHPVDCDCPQCICNPCSEPQKQSSNVTFKRQQQELNQLASITYDVCSRSPVPTTSTPVSAPTARSTPAGTCPYTQSVQVGGRKVDIHYPRSATSSRTVNVCPSAHPVDCDCPQCICNPCSEPQKQSSKVTFKIQQQELTQLASITYDVCSRSPVPTTSTPVSAPTARSTPAGTCPYTQSVQVGGRKVDIHYPRSATSSRTVNVCPSAHPVNCECPQCICNPCSEPQKQSSTATIDRQQYLEPVKLASVTYELASVTYIKKHGVFDASTTSSGSDDELCICGPSVQPATRVPNAQSTTKCEPCICGPSVQPTKRVPIAQSTTSDELCICGPSVQPATRVPIAQSTTSDELCICGPSVQPATRVPTAQSTTNGEPCICRSVHSTTSGPISTVCPSSGVESTKKHSPLCDCNECKCKPACAPPDFTSSKLPPSKLGPELFKATITAPGSSKFELEMSIGEGQKAPVRAVAITGTMNLRNLDTETIKRRLIEMENEAKARTNEIAQIRKFMSGLQSQCACGQINPMTAESRSFEQTISGLQCALAFLQEKCRKKDHMITVFTEELRLRTDSGVFDSVLHKIAAEKDTRPNPDYDRIGAANRLPTPGDMKSRQVMRTPAEKPCAPVRPVKDDACQCSPQAPKSVDPSPLAVTEVRRIAPDSLLLKWERPASQNIRGYEVEVNGEVKSRVYSAGRNATVLNGLVISGTMNLAVIAISLDGDRCLPAAKAVFQAHESASPTKNFKGQCVC